MALTIDQTIALFECLEVPYSVENNVLTDDGLLSTNQTITNSTRQAKTRILQYLTDSIYPNSGLTSNLAAKLDRWNELGTSTVSIENGSVGNIQGVTSDPDRERSLIQQKVVLTIPFWRCHEQILRSATSSVGLSRI